MKLALVLSGGLSVYIAEEEKAGRRQRQKAQREPLGGDQPRSRYDTLRARLSVCVCVCGAVCGVFTFAHLIATRPSAETVVRRHLH